MSFVKLSRRINWWVACGLFGSTALVLVAGVIFKSHWGAQPDAEGANATRHCLVPEASASRYPGMVWVPGGRFEMGDTTHAEELPLRLTSVSGFWMDRTEVTNDAFAQFVNATAYVTVAERTPDLQRTPNLPPEMRLPGAVVFAAPTESARPSTAMPWWRYTPGANWRHPGGPNTNLEGRGSFPVVALAWEDAKAYAAWKGRRLPTEAQWEWAARAGQAKAAQDHAQPVQANTWQGIFPVMNSADDGFVGLAPVGCYSANALGLFDMIGNVWEFTADVWTANHQTPMAAQPSDPSMPLRIPERVAMPGQHVIKGGSYLCAPNYCMRYRSGSRQPQDDDLGTSHLGFRTVLLAPGP